MFKRFSKEKKEKMNLDERVKEGWRISAEGYSGIVMNEYVQGEDKVWSDLILAQNPCAGKPDILDVGCGPGFFPLILSQRGYSVTGIDASPDMIAQARKNTALHGVLPRLEVMNSHETGFPDGSFDMIISRNVLWTLTKPLAALEEWRRLMKNGGRLVIFDADWFAGSHCPLLKKLEAEDLETYKARYGDQPLSYKKDEEDKARGWRADMPLPKEIRPIWDSNALRFMGFTNVRSEYISDRVYNERKKLLNRIKPMFMVCADKKSIPEML
jgi:SAM-dependent methyltransferase